MKSKRLNERGFTILPGTLIAIAISMLLSFVGVSGWIQANAGQSATLQTLATDWTKSATEQARANSNGATLYIDSSAAGKTTWTIFDGPPQTGLGPIDRVASFAGTVTLSGATQFVLAYSPAGAISAQPWTPTTGAVTRVSCPASGQWTLSETINSQTQSISIPCD
jgi:hypothetical protein